MKISDMDYGMNKIKLAVIKTEEREGKRWALILRSNLR